MRAGRTKADLAVGGRRLAGQSTNGERWYGWRLTDPRRAGACWADLMLVDPNKSEAHWGGLCWAVRLKDG